MYTLCPGVIHFLFWYIREHLGSRAYVQGNQDLQSSQMPYGRFSCCSWFYVKIWYFNKTRKWYRLLELMFVWCTSNQGLWDNGKYLLMTMYNTFLSVEEEYDKTDKISIKFQKKLDAAPFSIVYDAMLYGNQNSLLLNYLC